MNETDKTNQCAETSNLGAHATRLNALDITCQNRVLRATLASLWIDNPGLRQAIEDRLGRVTAIRIALHGHPALNDFISG